MPVSPSPFLNLATLFEVVVVLLVFAYIVKRYLAQSNKLDALAETLAAEGGALAAAKALMDGARDENHSDEWCVNALKHSLAEGTLVHKRAQLIERNASRLPETPLSRNMVQATDEARFWTGAFTFIGLCGTLLCLGVAVFYLMLIVGRSGSGPNLTSGLKEVVSHMVAVFGSMGAAFLSTATGVGATVKLAGKIALVERNWEDLRVRLEDFSLFELEPLASAMRSKQEDLTNVQTLVKTMEGIAGQFTEALSTTTETIRQIHEANISLHNKLESAATSLDDAAGDFAISTKGLGTQITSLTSAIERQETAQAHWNEGAVNTLKWLEEAVKGSLETFQRLDGLRAEVLQDSANTRADMRESLRNMNSLGQSIGGVTQQTLYQLKDAISGGLQSIKESIDAGVMSEERLLRQFEAILGQMGEYAAHVEGTLHQLPGAMGAEPLFLLENGQAEALGRLGEGLGHVRGEIVGLRSDVRDSLGGALREATSGKISEVGAKVDAIGGQFKVMSATADGVRQMQDNMTGLSAQIQTIDAQVRQMQSALGRWDRSFVIRLGGGG